MKREEFEVVGQYDDSLQVDLDAVRDVAQIRLTKIRAKMREGEDRRMSPTFHPLQRGMVPHLRLLCISWASWEFQPEWTRPNNPFYRPPLNPLLVCSSHLHSLTPAVRSPRSATTAPVSNLSVLRSFT